MFYLSPSWICFNTKLYISCEAGTWKLGLGHLPAPLILLKQLSLCRVLSPGMEVGDVFWYLWSLPCFLQLLRCWHISCPCTAQCHPHCKVLPCLKLHKFCKSLKIGWEVKVRPEPPARKLFHVLNCVWNWNTNQACFMAGGAFRTQACTYTDIWLSLFNPLMILRFYWWWRWFQSTEPGHDWLNPPCCDFCFHKQWPQTTLLTP